MLIKKTIAIVTLTLFILTQLAHNGSAETLSFILHSAEVKNVPALYPFIPPELGTIQELVTGSSPAIVHIQTAHGHYESQKKIQKILHLLKGQGFKLLLLEGTSFKLEPHLLRFFPRRKDLSMKVADDLVRKAVMKGSELFLMEAPEVEAYGIETLKPYRENVRLFRKVITQKQKAGIFLHKMDLQIKRLTSPYLNKDLKRFLRKVEDYESGQISFADWIAYLREMARRHSRTDFADPAHQLDWPMLMRVSKLKELESSLDPGKLISQRKAFLKTIAPYFQRGRVENRETFRQIERLLSMPLSDSHLPDPQTGLLFENMISMLPQGFRFSDYPQVVYWIGHLILQSELKSEPLLAEVEEWEKRVAEALSKTKAEKELISLFKDYRLLRKLFALELTPEDYQKLRQRTKETRPQKIIQRLLALNRGKQVQDTEFPWIQGIGKLYKLALAFYDGVKKRDEWMIQNIEKKLKETKEEKTVVITGGFHAQPFFQHFKARGFSYALIAPKITTVEGGQAYHEAVLQSPKNLLLESTLETPFPYSVPYANAKQENLNPAWALEQLIRSEMRAVSASGEMAEIAALANESPAARNFGFRYRPHKKGKEPSVQIDRQGEIFLRSEVRSAPTQEDSKSEKNLVIELQHELTRMIAQFRISNAPLDKEFIRKLAPLYLKIPISIPEDKSFLFYMDNVKEMKERQLVIYDQIEESFKRREKDIWKHNLAAIRINRLLFKSELKVAGMLLNGKAELTDPAAIRGLTLQHLNAAWDSAQALAEELNYRIQRLRALRMIKKDEAAAPFGDMIRAIRQGEDFYEGDEISESEQKLRSSIQTLVAQEMAFLQILEQRAHLEYYAERLKTADKKNSISDRDQRIISYGLSRFSEGSGFDIDVVTKAVKKHQFKNAEALLREIVWALDKNLEEVETKNRQTQKKIQSYDTQNRSEIRAEDSISIQEIARERNQLLGRTISQSVQPGSVFREVLETVQRQMPQLQADPNLQNLARRIPRKNITDDVISLFRAVLRDLTPASALQYLRDKLDQSQVVLVTVPEEAYQTYYDIHTDINKLAWVGQDGRFYLLGTFYQYLADLRENDAERARVLLAAIFFRLAVFDLLQSDIPRSVPVTEAIHKAVEKFAVPFEKAIAGGSRIDAEKSAVSDIAKIFIYRNRFARGPQPRRLTQTVRSGVSNAEHTLEHFEGALRSIALGYYENRKIFDRVGHETAAMRRKREEFIRDFGRLRQRLTAEIQRRDENQEISSQRLGFLSRRVIQGIERLNHELPNLTARINRYTRKYEELLTRIARYAGDETWRERVLRLNESAREILSRLILLEMQPSRIDSLMAQANVRTNHRTVLQLFERFRTLRYHMTSYRRELLWFRVREAGRREVTAYITAQGWERGIGDYLLTPEFFARESDGKIIYPRFIAQATGQVQQDAYQIIQDEVRKLTNGAMEREMTRYRRQRIYLFDTLWQLLDPYWNQAPGLKAFILERLQQEGIWPGLNVNQISLPQVIDTIRTGAIQDEGLTGTILDDIEEFLLNAAAGEEARRAVEAHFNQYLEPDINQVNAVIGGATYRSVFDLLRAFNHTLESYAQANSLAYEILGYLDDAVNRLNAVERRELENLPDALQAREIARQHITRDLEAVTAWALRGIKPSRRILADDMTAARLGFEYGDETTLRQMLQAARIHIQNYIDENIRISKFISLKAMGIRDFIRLPVQSLLQSARISEAIKVIERMRDRELPRRFASDEPGYQRARRRMTQVIRTLSARTDTGKLEFDGRTLLRKTGADADRLRARYVRQLVELEMVIYDIIHKKTPEEEFAAIEPALRNDIQQILLNNQTLEQVTMTPQALHELHQRVLGRSRSELREMDIKTPAEALNLSKAAAAIKTSPKKISEHRFYITARDGFEIPFNVQYKANPRDPDGIVIQIHDEMFTDRSEQTRILMAYNYETRTLRVADVQMNLLTGQKLYRQITKFLFRDRNIKQIISLVENGPTLKVIENYFKKNSSASTVPHSVLARTILGQSRSKDYTLKAVPAENGYFLHSIRKFPKTTGKTSLRSEVRADGNGILFRDNGKEYRISTEDFAMIVSLFNEYWGGPEAKIANAKEFRVLFENMLQQKYPQESLKNYHHEYVSPEGRYVSYYLKTPETEKEKYGMTGMDLIFDKETGDLQGVYVISPNGKHPYLDVAQRRLKEKTAQGNGKAQKESWTPLINFIRSPDRTGQMITFSSRAYRVEEGEWVELPDYLVPGVQHLFRGKKRTQTLIFQPGFSKNRLRNALLQLAEINPVSSSDSFEIEEKEDAFEVRPAFQEISPAFKVVFLQQALDELAHRDNSHRPDLRGKLATLFEGRSSESQKRSELYPLTDFPYGGGANKGKFRITYYLARDLNTVYVISLGEKANETQLKNDTERVRIAGQIKAVGDNSRLVTGEKFLGHYNLADPKEVETFLRDDLKLVFKAESEAKELTDANVSVPTAESQAEEIEDAIPEEPQSAKAPDILDRVLQKLRKQGMPEKQAEEAAFKVAEFYEQIQASAAGIPMLGSMGIAQLILELLREDALPDAKKEHLKSEAAKSPIEENPFELVAGAGLLRNDYKNWLTQPGAEAPQTAQTISVQKDHKEPLYVIARGGKPISRPLNSHGYAQIHLVPYFDVERDLYALSIYTARETAPESRVEDVEEKETHLETVIVKQAGKVLPNKQHLDLSEEAASLTKKMEEKKDAKKGVVSDIDRLKGYISEYLVLGLLSVLYRDQPIESQKNIYTDPLLGTYLKPDFIINRIIYDSKWGKLRSDIIATLVEYMLLRDLYRYTIFDSSKPLEILALDDSKAKDISIQGYVSGRDYRIRGIETFLQEEAGIPEDITPVGGIVWKKQRLLEIIRALSANKPSLPQLNSFKEELELDAVRKALIEKGDLKVGSVQRVQVNGDPENLIELAGKKPDRLIELAGQTAERLKKHNSRPSYINEQIKILEANINQLIEQLKPLKDDRSWIESHLISHEKFDEVILSLENLLKIIRSFPFIKHHLKVRKTSSQPASEEIKSVKLKLKESPKSVPEPAPAVETFVSQPEETSSPAAAELPSVPAASVTVAPQQPETEKPAQQALPAPDSSPKLETIEAPAAKAPDVTVLPPAEPALVPETSKPIEENKPIAAVPALPLEAKPEATAIVQAPQVVEGSAPVNQLDAPAVTAEPTMTAGLINARKKFYDAYFSTPLPGAINILQQIRGQIVVLKNLFKQMPGVVGSPEVLKDHTDTINAIDELKKKGEVTNQQFRDFERQTLKPLIKKLSMTNSYLGILPKEAKVRDAEAVLSRLWRNFWERSIPKALSVNVPNVPDQLSVLGFMDDSGRIYKGNPKISHFEELDHPENKMNIDTQFLQNAIVDITELLDYFSRVFGAKYIFVATPDVYTEKDIKVFWGSQDKVTGDKIITVSSVESMNEQQADPSAGSGSYAKPVWRFFLDRVDWLRELFYAYLYVDKESESDEILVFLKGEAERSKQEGKGIPADLSGFILEMESAMEAFRQGAQKPDVLPADFRESAIETDKKLQGLIDEELKPLVKLMNESDKPVKMTRFPVSGFDMPIVDFRNLGFGESHALFQKIIIFDRAAKHIGLGTSLERTSGVYLPILYPALTALEDFRQFLAFSPYFSSIPLRITNDRSIRPPSAFSWGQNAMQELFDAAIMEFLKSHPESLNSTIKMTDSFYVASNDRVLHPLVISLGFVIASHLDSSSVLGQFARHAVSRLIENLSSDDSALAEGSKHILLTIFAFLKGYRRDGVAQNIYAEYFQKTLQFYAYHPTEPFRLWSILPENRPAFDDHFLKKLGEAAKNLMPSLNSNDNLQIMQLLLKGIHFLLPHEKDKKARDVIAIEMGRDLIWDAYRWINQSILMGQPESEFQQELEKNLSILRMYYVETGLDPGLFDRFAVQLMKLSHPAAVSAGADKSETLQELFDQLGIKPLWEELAQFGKKESGLFGFILPQLFKRAMLKRIYDDAMQSRGNDTPIRWDVPASLARIEQFWKKLDVESITNDDLKSAVKAFLNASPNITMDWAFLNIFARLQHESSEVTFSKKRFARKLFDPDDQVVEHIDTYVDNLTAREINDLLLDIYESLLPKWKGQLDPRLIFLVGHAVKVSSDAAPLFESYSYPEWDYFYDSGLDYFGNAFDVYLFLGKPGVADSFLGYLKVKRRKLREEKAPVPQGLEDIIHRMEQDLRDYKQKGVEAFRERGDSNLVKLKQESDEIIRLILNDPNSNAREELTQAIQAIFGSKPGYRIAVRVMLFDAVLEAMKEERSRSLLTPFLLNNGMDMLDLQEIFILAPYLSFLEIDSAVKPLVNHYFETAMFSFAEELNEENPEKFNQFIRLLLASYPGPDKESFAKRFINIVNAYLLEDNNLGQTSKRILDRLLNNLLSDDPALAWGSDLILTSVIGRLAEDGKQGGAVRVDAIRNHAGNTKTLEAQQILDAFILDFFSKYLLKPDQGYKLIRLSWLSRLSKKGLENIKKMANDRRLSVKGDAKEIFALYKGLLGFSLMLSDKLENGQSPRERFVTEVTGEFKNQVLNDAIDSIKQKMAAGALYTELKTDFHILSELLKGNGKYQKKLRYAAKEINNWLDRSSLEWLAEGHEDLAVEIDKKVEVSAFDEMVKITETNPQVLVYVLRSLRKWANSFGEKDLALLRKEFLEILEAHNPYPEYKKELTEAIVDILGEEEEQLEEDSDVDIRIKEHVFHFDDPKEMIKPLERFLNRLDPQTKHMIFGIVQNKAREKEWAEIGFEPDVSMLDILVKNLDTSKMEVVKVNINGANTEILRLTFKAAVHDSRFAPIDHIDLGAMLNGQQHNISDPDFGRFPYLLNAVLKGEGNVEAFGEELLKLINKGYLFFYKPPFWALVALKTLENRQQFAAFAEGYARNREIFRREKRDQHRIISLYENGEILKQREAWKAKEKRIKQKKQIKELLKAFSGEVNSTQKNLSSQLAAKEAGILELAKLDPRMHKEIIDGIRSLNSRHIVESIYQDGKDNGVLLSAAREQLQTQESALSLRIRKLNVREEARALVQKIRQEVKEKVKQSNIQTAPDPLKTKEISPDLQIVSPEELEKAHVRFHENEFWYEPVGRFFDKKFARQVLDEFFSKEIIFSEPNLKNVQEKVIALKTQLKQEAGPRDQLYQKSVAILEKVIGSKTLTYEHVFSFRQILVHLIKVLESPVADMPLPHDLMRQVRSLSSLLEETVKGQMPELITAPPDKEGASKYILIGVIKVHHHEPTLFTARAGRNNFMAVNRPSKMLLPKEHEAPRELNREENGSYLLIPEDSTRETVSSADVRTLVKGGPDLPVMDGLGRALTEEDAGKLAEKIFEISPSITPNFFQASLLGKIEGIESNPVAQVLFQNHIPILSQVVPHSKAEASKKSFLLYQTLSRVAFIYFELQRRNLSKDQLTVLAFLEAGALKKAHEELKPKNSIAETPKFDPVDGTEWEPLAQRAWIAYQHRDFEVPDTALAEWSGLTDHLYEKVRENAGKDLSLSYNSMRTLIEQLLAQKVMSRGQFDLLLMGVSHFFDSMQSEFKNKPVEGQTILEESKKMQLNFGRLIGDMALNRIGISPGSSLSPEENAIVLGMVDPQGQLYLPTTELSVFQSVDHPEIKKEFQEVEDLAWLDAGWTVLLLKVWGSIDEKSPLKSIRVYRPDRNHPVRVEVLAPAIHARDAGKTLKEFDWAIHSTDQQKVGNIAERIFKRDSSIDPEKFRDVLLGKSSSSVIEKIFVHHGIPLLFQMPFDKEGARDISALYDLLNRIAYAYFRLQWEQAENSPHKEVGQEIVRHEVRTPPRSEVRNLLTPAVRTAFEKLREQTLPLRFFEQWDTKTLVAVLSVLLGRPVYWEKAGILAPEAEKVITKAFGEAPVTAAAKYPYWLASTVSDQGRVILDEAWTSQLIENSPKTLFVLLKALAEFQMRHPLREPLMAVIGEKQTFFRRVQEALKRKDNGLSAPEKDEADRKFFENDFAGLRQHIQVIEKAGVSQYIKTHDAGVAVLAGSFGRFNGMLPAAKFILDPSQMDEKDLIMAAFVIPSLLKAAALIRGVKDPQEQVKLLTAHLDQIVPGATAKGHSFMIEIAHYMREIMLGERLIEIAA